MVVGGKLKFTLSSKLPKSEHALLSKALKSQLKEITTHCLEKVKNKEQEYTPSDFDAQINQELLDKLQIESRLTKNLIEKSIRQTVYNKALSITP